MASNGSTLTGWVNRSNGSLITPAGGRGEGESIMPAHVILGCAPTIDA